MNRSVNAEINLKPGRYHVLMKITAYRYPDLWSTEEAVTRLAAARREKLVQIGLSYDLAHAKGRGVETEKEKRAREEYDRRRRAAERKKRCDETKKCLQREWIREQKIAARKKRASERAARRNEGLATSEQRLGDDISRRGSQESLVTNGADTAPAIVLSEGDPRKKPKPNSPIPTVQLNGCNDHNNPLKRKRRNSRRVSVDTHFATDGFDSSDLELLDGFEFDSDLDMPPEEQAAENTPQPSSPSPCPEELSSSDPWNAVCVVGLRIYSKDQDLSLEVVRPVPEDHEVEAALDMDDPAASATTEMGEWGQFGF